MVEMPCFESSVSTESAEGGLRPMGRGSHGLLIASFTTLSITSSACTKIKRHSKEFMWINGIEEVRVHDFMCTAREVFRTVR